jgi:hypothetical protein
MQGVKQVAKKIPGIPYLYRFLRKLYLGYKLKNTDTEKIFTDIFRRGKFGGKDSDSGPGSDLYQTRVIIKELPKLIRDLNISTILDIPCGDFLWMNSVNLDGVDYIGADIVNDLIQNNREKYERKNVNFRHLNIIDDELPKVDLILCRDCLVHLSFKAIFLALDNIFCSKSEYLLATTFTSRKKNRNIFTGEWRTLNLEIPPFDFPEPLRIINEACTECEGAYSDKSLGLWRIEEIKNKNITTI